MKQPVLDHGYVELIESWGSDERIIEAARMSTSKGFQGWGPRHADACGSSGLIQPHISCHCTPGAGDEKLLRYLWENKHHTPFEMAGMTIEVQAPIFVFREWHRHRTQSYNELSARYTELPDLFYLPDLGRIKRGKQSTKSKQGSEEGFTFHEAEEIRKDFQALYDAARVVYRTLLDHGVARELARLVIPVSQYSRMRASANLRNWLQFLSLRLPENAQYEIRQYAHEVSQIVALKFPRTHALFAEGCPTSVL